MVGGPLPGGDPVPGGDPMPGGDAVADLVGLIKRPEPEPATGLLPLRSLAVRGSFNEGGHGLHFT